MSSIIKLEVAAETEDGVLIESDKKVVVDISDLLSGPVFDIALTQIVSLLDDKVQDALDESNAAVERMYPMHDWSIDARLTLRLCYELDSAPGGTLEIELPEGFRVAGKDGEKLVPIGRIPKLIDRLERIYNNADPEDYHYLVDVSQLLS